MNFIKYKNNKLKLKIKRFSIKIKRSELSNSPGTEVVTVEYCMKIILQKYMKDTKIDILSAKRR